MNKAVASSPRTWGTLLPVGTYFVVLGRAWFAGRERHFAVVAGTYSAAVALALFLAPDYQSLVDLLPLLVLPLAFFGGSFVLLHFKGVKLPVRCLALGTGFLLAFASSVLRPLLQATRASVASGMLVPELVDLVVWSLVAHASFPSKNKIEANQ
ncbi:MAG: hypothetical protein Kow0069_39370 [Promethearchaeota archaeon]